MKINSYRLSLIWVDAIPKLLWGGSSGPLSRLLDRYKYAELFNRLLAVDGVADPLADLPWHYQPGSKKPEQNRYWNSMIDLSSGGNKGISAWRAALPLRYKPSLFKLNRESRTFVEGWYFPYGVGLSMTAWMRRDQEGKTLKEVIANLARGPVAITWPDGSVSNEKIDRAAGKAMDSLRRQGFGASPSGMTPNHQMILTIITAEHDAQDVQMKDREAAAEAMLEEVKNAAEAVRGEAVTVDRSIYALAKNRVIWNPDCIVSKQEKLHTMGCLHRNIMAATLYVAFLIRSAEIIMAEVDRSGQIPPKAMDYARVVAGRLGRLYGLKSGDDHDSIYVQPCMKEQIAQASRVVSDLRLRLDMPALQ